jgi:hypothetical protein
MQFKVTRTEIDGTKHELEPVEAFTFMDAEREHERIKQLYPDDFINFISIEGSFICGQPLNMKLDGEQWKEGRLDWNSYINKWYPKLLSEHTY